MGRLLRRVLRRAQKEREPIRLNVLDAAVKLPATYIEAAKSLKEVRARKLAKNRDRMTVFDQEGMHPDMIRFVKAMNKQFAQREYAMYPFELLRTPERQAKLYKQGRTKAMAGQSPHQYGCAVDIISCVKYWDLTPNQWEVIGAIGKEVARRLKIKVVWGGDWKFYDPAHWEIENWRDYRQVIQQAIMDGEEIPQDTKTRFQVLTEKVKALH